MKRKYHDKRRCVVEYLREKFGGPAAVEAAVKLGIGRIDARRWVRAAAMNDAARRYRARMRGGT